MKDFILNEAKDIGRKNSELGGGGRWKNIKM